MTDLQNCSNVQIEDLAVSSRQICKRVMGFLRMIDDLATNLSQRLKRFPELSLPIFLELLAQHQQI